MVEEDHMSYKGTGAAAAVRRRVVHGAENKAHMLLKTTLSLCSECKGRSTVWQARPAMFRPTAHSASEARRQRFECIRTQPENNDDPSPRDG